MHIKKITIKSTYFFTFQDQLKCYKDINLILREFILHKVLDFKFYMSHCSY